MEEFLAKPAGIWTGRILSGLPALGMVASGIGKVMQIQANLDAFAKLGIKSDLVLPIGVLELVCVSLYLMPRTAVLGALLSTAYLGAAFFSHLRAGDPMMAPPIVFAVLLWAGLCAREPRLRALLPLRR